MDLLLLTPFALMVVLLLIGFPIAFSLAAAGVAGILLVSGDVNTVIGVIGMVTYSTVASYVLTTLPMFNPHGVPGVIGWARGRPLSSRG